MTFAPESSVPLAPLTTIRLGGPARELVKATTQATIQEALSYTRQKSIPLFVLGGGSNVVFDDGGYPGVVLAIRLRGIDEETIDENQVLVTAQAGEPWDEFVAGMVAKNYSGLECLSGIPGTVGATPIQNVGAYGQEVAETIQQVDCVDRITGEKIHFANQECGFGYRSSRFKQQDRDRYIITAVHFMLRRNGPAALRYPELARAFEGQERPSLSDVRQAVIRLRKSKAMVLDEEDQNTRSCGSFFLNPIVEDADLRRIKRDLDEDVPAFAQAGGRYKVSAAWLIEKAGFERGLARGGCGISRRHSLALINRGSGTAAEIRGLAAEIRERVLARTGVTLHPEPIILDSNGERVY